MLKSQPDNILPFAAPRALAPVLGELVSKYTKGDFMRTKFRETCDTVLRFRDHKLPLLRAAVLSPRTLRPGGGVATCESQRNPL